MARLGSSQSLLGRVLALDEYVRLLRGITLDDVNAVLAELLTPAATEARVGPGS